MIRVDIAISVSISIIWRTSIPYLCTAYGVSEMPSFRNTEAKHEFYRLIKHRDGP